MPFSRHLGLFVVKWLLNAAALAIALPIGGAAFTSNIIWLSLVVALVLYVLGDLFVLPRTGNWTASVVDALTAGIVVWLMTPRWAGARFNLAAFVAVALTIGIVEFFLHPAVRRAFRGPEVLTRVGNSPVPIDPINNPGGDMKEIRGDNNQVQYGGEQPARTGADSEPKAAKKEMDSVRKAETDT